MNKLYSVLLFAFSSLILNTLTAQTIWTGPTTTFTKQGFADWTLEANQDRITDNVWITRANNSAIFNIKTETSYTSMISPADTEWAYGTTANIGSLTFKNFEATNGSKPPSMINKDMVLHLITDNIYIDIKFLSYTDSGSGAEFSYQRSTNQNLSITDFQQSLISIYPNPSKDFIKIQGIFKETAFTIYNMLGETVNYGTITNNNEIEIKDLPHGTYLLNLNNLNTIQFIKED